VVWANSGKVGCAVHNCAILQNLPRRRQALYVMCNYWPSGNVNGLSKYTKGPACSKCRSGAGWCKNKLCKTQCTSAGEGCSCAVVCYNCAELDRETCQCKCAKGWHGPYCTKLCKDRHALCGRPNGWPKSWCKGKYGKDIQAQCPAVCGVCEADPEAKEGLCAPVRGPAADSAQTMFIKSHQSTMTFLITVIMAFTINSYDAL